MRARIFHMSQLLKCSLKEQERKQLNYFQKSLFVKLSSKTLSNIPYLRLLDIQEGP